jgi:photosystem II stability/assembly factor-like uncharacterized protein
LAINPASTNVIYAGTVGGNGIYKSTDGGGSWAEMSSGLMPSTHVGSLAISPDSPTVIYAGTWGGGVFRYVEGTKIYLPLIVKNYGGPE